jgi:hypothetical protein
MWKNSLNFLKDVPMMHVNLMTIAHTVHEKERRGATFVGALALAGTNYSHSYEAQNDTTARSTREVIPAMTIMKLTFYKSIYCSEMYKCLQDFFIKLFQIPVYMRLLT